MFNTNYTPVQDDVWVGRIDSEINYDAFRWHQWVKKIDLKDESLKPFSDKIGIAFIGFCCDHGVLKNKGRVGASKGPQSIREELTNLPCSFDPSLKLYDAGDIHVETSTVEEAQFLLSQAIERLLELNLFPIVLGGGHEVALGHYNGLNNFFKKNCSDPKIGIINFDAHFDIRPYPNGSSSGTMFRQIADGNNINNMEFLYFCLGIQKRGNTIELFKSAKELGIKYILASEILDTDIWPILEQLDSFIKRSEKIYVTICADVFSSGYAPGVSAAQPLGLEPEKVIKLLKHILKSGKTVSFDIAEVSPRFDQDHITARLASTLIFSIVNTLAEINDLSYEFLVR